MKEFCIPKTKTLIFKEKFYNHSLKDPTMTSAWLGNCEAEGLTWEGMWVIGFDGRNRPRFVEQVAQGGGHGLVISPKEILFRVCAQNTSAFIMVHNHPSGDPTPSPEDIEMTEKVRDAAKVIGLICLDHVIVSEGNHFSMLESGFFDD